MTVGLITKISLYKMFYFPKSYSHSKNTIKAQLDLFNYATKSDLLQKGWFDWYKVRYWKVDLDKLLNVSSALNNLKSRWFRYFNLIKIKWCSWYKCSQKIDI